ncbi:phage tail protein [Novosphingobium sp. B 225]|uniref:phage tail protein n=1 Tax=Novosphingobium sp. B 225 TaxID=1961849 RepID=UPI000B4BDE55|nr:tail fiber protein [Novosphingobium sp. B 225]
MSDSDLIGEIRLFPFDFVPRGWLACDGSLIKISGHTALYAVIGKAWGGDGIDNFALPDLNCRAVMGANADAAIGTHEGQDQVTLNYQQMPAHRHTLQRKAAVAIGSKLSSPGIQTNYGQIHVLPASGGVVVTSNLVQNGTPDTQLSSSALSPNGLGGGHENRQPFLVLIYAICTDGMFPTFP